MSNLASSDLETMEINGVQVPVFITYVNKLERKSFMIDNVLLKTNQELALDKLWREYFDYICQFHVLADYPEIIDTLFFHNLGSFDGYFLYKALLNYTDPGAVETIIDDANKFITITLDTEQGTFTFKDSLRIFPMPLKSLCKSF